MLHKAFALLLAARILAPVLLSALQALATTFIVGLGNSGKHATRRFVFAGKPPHSSMPGCCVAGDGAGVLSDASARSHATNRIAFASRIVDIAGLVQCCHAILSWCQHRPTQRRSSTQAEGSQECDNTSAWCHGGHFCASARMSVGAGARLAQAEICKAAKPARILLCTRMSSHFTWLHCCLAFWTFFFAQNCLSHCASGHAGYASL